MSSTETHSLHERLALAAVENYEYRFAMRDDAETLALLFETFFNEAHYQDRGIRYSTSKAEAWLRGVIVRGSCPHLAALKDGEIIGAISYSLDETFCVEPVAVLHMFYVLPAHRQTAVGRVLLGLCADAAKTDGAVAFHAPLASGVKERSLVNLFAHGGFAPIGTIVGRAL